MNRVGSHEGFQRCRTTHARENRRTSDTGKVQRRIDRPVRDEPEQAEYRGQLGCFFVRQLRE